MFLALETKIRIRSTYGESCRGRAVSYMVKEGENGHWEAIDHIQHNLLLWASYFFSAKIVRSWVYVGSRSLQFVTVLLQIVFYTPFASIFTLLA